MTPRNRQHPEQPSDGRLSLGMESFRVALDKDLKALEAWVRGALKNGASNQPGEPPPFPQMSRFFEALDKNPGGKRAEKDFDGSSGVSKRPVKTKARSVKDSGHGGFQVTSELTICPDSQEGILRCSAALHEPSLCALVREGKAMYATEIHCARTYFRQLLKSANPAYEVRLERGALSSKVRVSSYVICTQPVTGHTGNSTHALFGDATADFNPGDVLAVAQPVEYDVERLPLHAIGSIFELLSHLDPEKLFSVDWSDSKVQITMHADEAAKFLPLWGDKEVWASLLSSVYLIALREILRLMTGEEGGPFVKEWLGVIQQEIDNRGLSMDGDALEFVQRLLGKSILKLASDSKES